MMGKSKVHAIYGGEPYDGSVVNMGSKKEAGSVCWLIGITKAIHGKIKKQYGYCACDDPGKL